MLLGYKTLQPQQHGKIVLILDGKKYAQILPTSNEVDSREIAEMVFTTIEYHKGRRG